MDEKEFKVPQAAKRWMFSEQKPNETYLTSKHTSPKTQKKKDGEISTENAFRMILAESWQVKKNLHKHCALQSGTRPVF